MHPGDERYRHLIGATCLVPILKRPIPVIHDTYVDMAFGTGALKITPGHDPDDFEIGLIGATGLAKVGEFNQRIDVRELHVALLIGGGVARIVRQPKWFSVSFDA